MMDMTYEEYQEVIRLLDLELNEIRGGLKPALEHRKAETQFNDFIEYNKERLHKLLPIKAKLVTMQAKTEAG